jgi:hypothetical protein
MRQTTCDAQGYFAFDHVPDGSFYVAAEVVWKANGNSFIYEGGALMKPVTLKGGESTKLTLSQQ